jgi:ribonucleotide reductase alpha subunit
MDDTFNIEYSNGKLSESAEIVAKSRYFMEGENWEKCSLRVADTISNAEGVKKLEYRDKFHEMIYDMDFIPAGRILRNSGRPRGSLFNCYVLPIGDSIEEIGNYLKETLILWSSGGGVGCNFSNIRPKGDPILGKGGPASGLVSFLEASDFTAKTIESGGSRRAAGLACVDISHPEVLDFINAKLVDGRLSYYNISVAINNDFLEAVEKDDLWEYKFKQRSYGTVKARVLWNAILQNAVKCAEPGILNFSNLTKNNSYYYDPVVSTNPCMTGDTLVAVADGRGEVSFKQLVDEGKDVPVFCKDDNNNIAVSMMRNPRVTGKNHKILKVYLDDGSFIRGNETHKIIMFDGSEKMLKDLKSDDRLHHMIKYDSRLKDVIQSGNNKQEYTWMTNGFQQNVAEHRVIAEFKVGRKLNKEEVVHHINYDYRDNNPNNLEVMSKVGHDNFHKKDMYGDNNPMRRFPEKNYFKSHKFLKDKNPNSFGYTRSQMIDITVRYIEDLGRRPSITEWGNFCKGRYSTGYYIWKEDGSLTNFIDKCMRKTTLNYIEGTETKEYKKYMILKKNTDLDIYFDGGIKVNKVCEYCGKTFTVPWGGRERSFCSKTCFNKSNYKRKKTISYYLNDAKKRRLFVVDIYRKLKDKLRRIPLRYELEGECKKNNVSCQLFSDKYKSPNKYFFNYYKDFIKFAESSINYKVVRIEEDGYEDVYNGTVDKYHNFYTFTKETKTKNGRPKLNFVNNRNCGEATLSNHEVCDLGSLVLPNFVTGNINTNWKKLENTIRLAVRFLDDVIDVNKYEIDKIDVKAHNSRRIGIGVMGLAEYLFSKQVRYGSDKAIQEIDKLMRVIRDTVYQSLVELSVEKGAFPKFDPIQYTKASFIRKLPVSLRMDIKNKGVRCVTGMAFAPTGTISLLPEVTGGIEPLFSKAYRRDDRVSSRTYIHPLYKKILESGKDIPEWYVDTDDLRPQDHFEVQSIVQKYVDGAVSKTINLPKGTTPEQLNDLLLEYVKDLKGVTVYVDGSRGNQILNRLTKKELLQHIKEDSHSNSLVEEDVKCSSGACEI